MYGHSDSLEIGARLDIHISSMRLSSLEIVHHPQEIYEAYAKSTHEYFSSSKPHREDILEDQEAAEKIASDRQWENPNQESKYKSRNLG